MNAPSRYEQFQLQPGEDKVSVQEDTKIPNAATLTINKEDHTLANMLRAQLLLLPFVLFAGYKVPHPLEPRVVIKVQTDGTKTPIEAVHEACAELIRTLAVMKSAYHHELDKANVRNEGAEGGEWDSMEGMEGGVEYGAF